MALANMAMDDNDDVNNDDNEKNDGDKDDKDNAYSDDHKDDNVVKNFNHGGNNDPKNFKKKLYVFQGF